MRYRSRAAHLTGLLLAGCLLHAGETRAQSPGSADGEIRVVESVDPVSGRRVRQAVYDLTRKEIRSVQRALRRAGYLGVGWTGRLDHGTVRALDRLQEDRGLVRCGCVSYETVVALGLRPSIEVVTVATGAASDAWVEGPRRWCSTCLTGTYVPIAIPLPPPDEPEEGQPPVASGSEAAREYPPHGAVPPGVRPLPTPARAVPATQRPGALPRVSP